MKASLVRMRGMERPDTPSDTKNAKKYGGAVKSSVLVLSYPSVPTMEGKNLFKDSAVIKLIPRTTNM